MLIFKEEQQLSILKGLHLHLALYCFVFTFYVQKGKSDIIYKNKIIDMSRCEHGQPIKLFCVSDTCNWRDAGGCQNCLKKYHTHVQNIDTITIDKLEQLIRMFSVDSQVKNKSRALQQAVYNYFIVMKSQLSNSIDAVSKVITNKLSFPYLHSQGHLNMYRKIRNKQLKKITKKQIKNFCQFANTQNKQLIQFNERKLYLQEVRQLSNSIKSINESFVAYSRAIDKIDKSFNLERSFYNKITEMCASIQSQQKKGQNLVQITKDSIAQVSKEKVDEKIKNINTSRSAGRDRKVSIDNAMGLDLNKFSSPANQNFDQNEKQISQKKKRLFEMLNGPIQVRPSQKTESKRLEATEQKNRRTQNDMISQAKSLQKQIRKIEIDRKILKSNTIQNEKSNAFQNQPASETAKADRGIQQVEQRLEQEKQHANNEVPDAQKTNIFEDLLSKGINLPQMILHTILPRQASKQKLYEDTKDVKQRKITIPVKQFEQKEENQSPLLKIKRQRRKQTQQSTDKQNVAKESEMNKISFFDKKQVQSDSIVQASEEAENHISPVKDKQANQQNLLLKDRQADSLALLLESLRLPAEKAIPLLQTAIKFAYNNLSAAEYLSYLYLEIEKPRQCLDLCNKILQQLEDSPQAMQLSIHINNNKAAALNMLGRYSESIGILQKCLAFSKRDIYYKNLGDSYFSIAIYEKACLNYQNAIKLNPHLDQACYNLAVCYFLQDHLHEAKLNVSNALRLNPKNEQYLRLSRQITLKLQL